MIRPRIGLLVPFVPFYEKIVPLRPEKEHFARTVTGLLAVQADVVPGGLVCSEEEARQAGDAFLNAAVDAVVVVPSIAVFGALPWAALEILDAPVCIWNLQPDPAIPPDYNIRSLIRNSGGLGVQALANTLARVGRPFEVVFSSDSDQLPSKLLQFLRAAAVASALCRARFGQIGSVFPQMTDVCMDHAAWPGAPIVVVETAEIARSYEAQTESDVATRVGEIHKYASREITSDELARSARLSVALDALVNRLQLSGGAFNCHGENCLQNSAIGVTACYAVSAQTAQGHPFSCTGDLPTSIALWMLRQLADWVIYGELDLVDESANVILLANGGEGDFDAASGPVTIAGNENFVGVHGRGASLQFEIAPGPATLLSFTPLNDARGYRMIVAEGETVSLELPQLGVFHAAFRFNGLNAGDAFERWWEAGAVHHVAIGPGNWRGELERVARFSKFEVIVIGESNEI